MSGDGTDLPVAPPQRSARRHAITAIKLSLCALVLALVGRALARQFSAVPWHEMDLDAGLATGAGVALLGVSFVQLVMFRSLLLAYGHRLPWRDTLVAAWIPPLGKYVPGKVASVAGAVYLLRRRGVETATAVGVAVMLDGLAVVAGLIVSTPLLLWEPVRRQLPTAWAWCAAAALAGLVVLHPRVFVSMINLLLRRLRRPPIDVIPRTGLFAIAVTASLAQWLLAGTALWLMTRSVTALSTTTLPLFIATAAMAMTLSYLALFAPAGLGVREGLYLLTLGPLVGPKAAIVVVAMRLMQTLIELALAGTGLWILRASTIIPPALTPAEARR